MKHCFFILLIAIGFSQSCSPDPNPPAPNPDPNPVSGITVDPALGELDLAILDAAPDTIIKLEDIVLNNGQTVQYFLNQNDPDFLQKYPSKKKGTDSVYSPEMQQMLFISRVFGVASFLIDTTNHQHSEGIDKILEPDQVRLAYSYGSRDYDVRQLPPSEETDCRTQKIYGLDCSGMIYEEITRAGLPEIVPKNEFCVAAINDTSKWNKAFKKSDEFKDLYVDDLGSIKQEDMKNGDIIIWPGVDANNGPHIGIIKGSYILQIYGKSKKPGCESNMSWKNKPRAISIANNLNKFGGGVYKIFRIKPDNKYGYIKINFDGQNYEEKLQELPIIWKLNTTSYFGFSTLNSINKWKVYLQLPTYSGPGSYILKYGTAYNNNSYFQLQDHTIASAKNEYLSWRYSKSNAGTVTITKTELKNGAITFLEGTFDCYVTLDVTPYDITKHITGSFSVRKP